MKIHRNVIGFLALAGMACAATAQDAGLLLVDSTADRVMLLSAQDGSIINPDFITETALGIVMETPKEALVVNNEIWITDQVADRVFRVSLDGTTSLGDFGTGQLDNVRGLEVIGDKAFVCNDGSVINPNSIVVFDLAGTFQSAFVTGASPFDAYQFNGELLVVDGTDNNVERFDPVTGNLLGEIIAAGPMVFPQQIVLTPTSTLLVAGFSPPTGFFEFDTAGTLLNTYVAGTSCRAAYPLGNGNILYVGGGGAGGFIRSIDPVTGDITVIQNGGITPQYVNPIGLVTPCYPDCDADGTLSVDDFICFQTFFALGDPYADCDDDGVLSVDDFICFQTFFAVGC